MTTLHIVDILAILDDLQHDLGKHLLLPLIVLPPDASDAQVQAAVTRALQATRIRQDQTQSAAHIWQQAQAALPELPALHRAVLQALAWRDKVIVREDLAQVVSDFREVAAAIRQARAKLERDGVR